MAGKSTGKRGAAGDGILSKHLFGAKQEIAGDSKDRAGTGGSGSSHLYERVGGVLYRRKLENGCLTYGEVLEKDKRQDAIASSHQRRNGKHHFNLEETYGNVAVSYWWEDMFLDVRDFVHKCKECKQKNKPTAFKPNLITKEMDSHGADVLGKLNNQRATGLFCDVSLVLDGVSYPAHKAVLGAVSEYFQEVFTEIEQTSTEKTVVDLTGFNKDSFLALLEFSYTSSLSFKAEDLLEVYALARHFRMWEVVNMCKTLQASKVLNESMEYDKTQSKEEKDFFSVMNSSWTGSDRKFTFRNLDDKPNAQKSELFQDQNLSKSPDCTVALQRVEMNDGSCMPLKNPSRCFKLLNILPTFPKSTEVPLGRNLSSPKATSHFGLKVNSGSTTKYANENTPTKCKHLRFSHLLQSDTDCIPESVIPEDEMAKDCSFIKTPLKSPARQSPNEDEVHSPNTAEKYKLLSVLGLRRKMSAPINNEELIGWRQKKRLRKPKIRNYTMCSGRKKRKQDKCNVELQGSKEDTSEGENVDVVKGIIGKQTQEAVSKGLRSLKTVIVKKGASNKVRKRVGMLKRKGNGWTRKKRKSNTEKLQSQSEASGLDAVKPLEEKDYALSGKLGAPGPRKRFSIGRSTDIKQTQRNQNVKMTPKVNDFSKRYSLPKKNKFGSPPHAQIKSIPAIKKTRLCSKGGTASLVTVCKKHPGEDISKSEKKKREVVKRYKKDKVKKKHKCVHVIKSKTIQIRKGGKLGRCQQKVCGIGKKRKERKSCRLNLDKSLSKNCLLGKRKRQPTQKMLDAGLQGFRGSSVAQGSADGTKNHRAKLQARSKTADYNQRKLKLTKFSTPWTAAKTALISNCKSTLRNGRKRKQHSTAQVPEGVTKPNMAKTKTVKTVLLYGKKLLNLSNKDSLIKKGRRKCTTGTEEKPHKQLSTSKKATRLLEFAGTCSKVGVSEKLPKKLQKVSQLLKKKQTEILQSIKRNTKKGSKTSQIKKRPLRSISHCCSECNVVFANCDALIMHRMKHIEGKKWPCPVCRKSFYKQQNVKIHLQSHQQKLFRCKTCIKD